MGKVVFEERKETKTYMVLNLKSSKRSLRGIKYQSVVQVPRNIVEA